MPFDCFLPKQGTTWMKPGDPCVKASVPDECPKCAQSGNTSAVIPLVLGNSGEPGAFMAECEHLFSWEDAWKVLGSTVAPSQAADPDTLKKVKASAPYTQGNGASCKHCGEINPYADSGPTGYSCYSCRQAGYA